MLRLLKTLLCLVMAGTLVESAFGFALLGPAPTYPGAGGMDAWQTQSFGFNPMTGTIRQFVPLSLLNEPLQTGPKNLGEEYRRNTPDLYYAFDANFLDYFGSNGVASAEQAISVFNSLTNVSDYSKDLSEFPESAQRENFEAEALSLLDVKSEVMQLLIEQLGLTDPIRYTWVVHGRFITTPPPCPNPSLSYQIVQRNFDPVTLTPSAYVNGTLYSYFTFDVCAPPPQPLVTTEVFPVDPLARAFTPIANLYGDLWDFTIDAGLINGKFYTGLTRDDVGGLRYLWSTNNVNWETAGSNTVSFATNTSPQILVTSNLNLFISQAQTNNAATLQGLYPGLVVTSSSNWFGLQVTTNVAAVFTNSPYAPAGNTYLMLVTNYTTNVVQFFYHTFLNVVTNELDNSGFVTVQTITTGSSPNGPAGGAATPITNETTTVVSGTYGDFYIVPTNLCSLVIITNLLPTVVAATNSITATNAAAAGTTNTQSFTMNTITYYTNHTMVYYPVTCPTNAIELRQGIEHLTFVRENYDSLLGRFFNPVTNIYVLNQVTNGLVKPETEERIVTAPDILFSAQDLNGTGNGVGASVIRNVNFNLSNVGAGLAGPGTIEPSTTLIFNKAGPTYEIFWPLSQNPYTAQASQLPLLIWGSFDGTTNAPVVYPVGTSIENLANQILLHPDIPTGVLPSATNGVAYTYQLNAVGGQPPYTWALTPTSPGLPPGLTLSSGGLISGTPTMTGTFDFVVRLSDSSTRTVDWNYTILIKPQ